MDLVRETTAPLAWDQEQMPFQLPPEAIAWKVRLFTARPGRPPGVYGDHGILHLGLDATVEDLRRAVKGKQGAYRLYPVSADGKELSPIGCMDIVADEPPVTPEIVHPGDPIAVTRDVLALCTQMAASRDAHDELISKVLTTLVTTTATIQRSTAALLGAANSTIQVANGVDALERQEPPQLDAGSVAEQLAEMLTPDEADSKTQPPLLVQLLTGPIGMGLMNIVGSFAQTLAQAHATAATQQAQAQPTQPQAPEPAPAPQPRAQPRPRNAAGMSKRERKQAEKAARAARKRQVRAARAAAETQTDRPGGTQTGRRDEIPDDSDGDPYDIDDLEPDDSADPSSP